VRITIFNSKFDSVPKAKEVTWDELVAMLGEDRPVTCPTKTYYLHVEPDGTKTKVEIDADRCPSLTRHNGERLPHKCEAREVNGWSPGIWPSGSTTRKQADVVAADVLVFDIDHTTQAQLAEIDARIEAAGLAAILHSSHSHDPERGDVCVRLVLKASRTMTAAEIVPTRQYVERLLGLPTDPATKDLGRLYFVPTRPALGPERIFGHQDGKPVEVQPASSGLGTGLLSQIPAGADARGTAPAPGAIPDPVLSRTNGDMVALKKALQPNHNDYVRRMFEGLPFAEPGFRDAAMHSLAGYLTWRLPTASLEALVEMGRRSCMAMDPTKDLDKWREKLTRAIDRAAAHHAEQLLKSQAQVGSYRSESARAHPDEDDPDNTDPFPQGKLEAWANAHGCRTVGEFSKRWIIRFHGANWIFCNGRYDKAVPDSEIVVSMRRDLARSPVTLTKQNAAGEWVPRHKDAVLYEHATAARAVQASLSLRESFYDPSTQTFHEAVCPIRRDLKPVEHREIQEWLWLFGGDVLLDWVAVVSQLDRSAAALYIEGPKGTGKNVLVDGLARLWHKGGASAFKDVIGANFNDSLTRCPLIHADEGIPKTDTIIDDLRRLIGSNQQPLNRKFMPVVSLEGCPRLIITANNDRVLLDTGAHMGPADIEAVAQRIRQLKATKEAADFLAARRERHGHGYIESWIKDDHVARHALWLAENRNVDQTKRFLVEGNDQAQAELMTTGTGQVGAIMEFLARYLSDSAAAKTGRIRPGGGRLLVNTEALADRHQWERFVPSRKIPSARLISDSLRAVSDGVEHADGLDYFRVKPHMLINWSRLNQVGSPSKIEGPINANA